MVTRFGTDGIRGIANTQITSEVALAIGRATAQVFPASHVVLGRDTRRSGAMLEAATAAGICAEGADAVVLGVVPTPAVAYLAARDGVPGIVISASHNPFGDNGLKVFGPGGRKLSDAEQQALEAVIAGVLAESADRSTDAGAPVGAAVGTVVPDPLAVPAYLETIAASIDGRRLDGLHVVVDCANGANSEIAPQALLSLGAQVTALSVDPDGTNINDGCGSTYPEQLQRAVVERGADVGIAFDGDADRLVAVGADGSIVDGDRIIALCAVDLKERSALANNTVVVTVMSNLGLHRAMVAADIAVVSTPVGDRHVLQALAVGGHSLGGEQSGHIILADRSTTGDGLLAAVALLDLVVRRHRPLAELAAESMVQVPQVLLNVEVDAPMPDVTERLAEPIRTVTDRLGDDGRVLVRPSGTEPVVRVMIEAVDAGVAHDAAEELAASVRRLRD